MGDFPTMMKPAAWTARKFSFDRPVEAFPEVLERLRGTPARAAELVQGFSDQTLALRMEGKWSAKQHTGHLADLMDLDEKRLEEFLSGAAVLSAADMTNRATEAANHNQKPMATILSNLRSHRSAWASKLDSLTESDVARTALHPRLQQPMRLIDWACFVAEHDDHHLAAARYVLLNSVETK
jgi:hypothetical protein